MRTTFIPTTLFQIKDNLILQRINTKGIFPDTPNYIHAIEHIKKHMDPIVDLQPLSIFARNEALLSRVCFIVHTSRCGSTLLTRMLSECKSVLCISEAPPIGDLLQLGLPSPQRAMFFHQLVCAILESFSDSDTCPIVRFSSWGIWHLETILAAFPNNPWIFLYRNPEEVAVSLLDSPSAWIASQQILHLDATKRYNTWCKDRDFVNKECHIAWILGDWFRTIKHYITDHLMFVDYEKIKANFYTKILPHFRLPLPKDKERKAVEKVAKWNAKSFSKEIFTNDVQKKQEAVSFELRQALEKLTLPFFYEIIKQ